MRRLFTNPWNLIAMLWVLFGLILWLTAGRLPPTVASHFDYHGQADGWMSRQSHVQIFSALAFVMPLGLYVMFSLAGKMPDRLWNLPNREYWLAPERRSTTLRLLRQRALWLGSLVLLFVIGLYLLTFEANLRQPAALSTVPTLLLLGVFLLAVAIWVTSLMRQFRR